MFPGPGVNVAPAGNPLAVSDVIASPSASAAVTFTVSSAFSSTDAVAGAVTTGAWSTFPTVIDVEADPDSTLVAVNVTV